MALNGEFNFQVARASTGSRNQSGPILMDLSYADEEEVDFRAAGQRMGIRRCFVCGDARHFRTGFP